MLLWATGFVGAKLGLPHAPPLKFLLWRFAVVIALMAPLALLTGAPWPKGRKVMHVAVAGVHVQGHPHAATQHLLVDALELVDHAAERDFRIVEGLE